MYYIYQQGQFLFTSDTIYSNPVGVYVRYIYLYELCAPRITWRYWSENREKEKCLKREKGRNLNGQFEAVEVWNMGTCQKLERRKKALCWCCMPFYMYKIIELTSNVLVSLPLLSYMGIMWLTPIIKSWSSSLIMLVNVSII